MKNASEPRRIEHLPPSEQHDLVLQKWGALISINFDAVDVGFDLNMFDHTGRKAIRSQVLAGTATSTLNRLSNQLSKYLGRAALSQTETFPITRKKIIGSVQNLVELRKPRSAVSGFVESLKFAKRVLRWDIVAR